MLNVKTTINNGGKSQVREFANVIPSRLKTGLYKAGLLVESDAKKKLSGPSNTKVKGSNPFPGVVTGNLRRSVTTDCQATRVVIGPGGLAERYAAIQEFGGMAGRNRLVKIPARPYMSKALETVHDKAIDIMFAEFSKAV